MKNRTSFEHFFPEAVAGSDAERIAELEQKIRNLEYAIKMRDDHRAELEKQNAGLLELLQELENRIVVPAKNCSCHISPPCNDCVDYAGLRETLEAVDRVLQKAALQPSTQEVSK